MLALLLCGFGSPPPKEISKQESIDTARISPSGAYNVQEWYVASKRSRMFHCPECPSAHKILIADEIRFGSYNTAVNAGYAPCGTCAPD
ncbi:hypothetical protein ACFLZ2_05585 [Candidatus Margulisiibacteriota bacterium]